MSRRTELEEENEEGAGRTESAARSADATVEGMDHRKEELNKSKIERGMHSFIRKCHFLTPPPYEKKKQRINGNFLRSPLSREGKRGNF